MCVLPFGDVKTSVDPSWWRPLGMRASSSCRVDFTGAEIDENCLVGRPGDYYRQPWFGGGAMRFAAVQLGAAEALFDEMRRSLTALGRTNDVLQQTRAGEITVALASGNQWMRAAAEKMDAYLCTQSADESAQRAARVVTYANMMRTATEEICLKVMRLVERSVGARALMRPHPIERIHRDLTMYLRQPAPDAVLLDVGRNALHRTDEDDAWDSASPCGDESR